MFKGKRVLVVIPARGGSKGIKLKNLRKINSISLIGLVGNCVKEIKNIDKIVLSSDHDGIAKEAKRYGIEVPFKRPKELSGDRISDWQVLNHALTAMEKIESKIFDIVIMLQPTSPLRKPFHIEKTLNHLIENNFDSVWTISKTDSKYHPKKQLILKDKEFDFYEAEGANIIARQQLSEVYHRNGICYAFTRKCIISLKNIKGIKSGFVLIDEPSISIDNEEDLSKAEMYLKNL